MISAWSYGLPTMEKLTSRDGTTIAVETVGSGPPVVLVVGAFCTRATTRELAALLATDCTVHAYDRRGRGDSGDTPPYDVAREFEDLAAVCAHAGGAPALYGHSSGAVLVARAVIGGLAASRLVLHEPPWSGRAGGDDGGSALARDVDAALADGRPGDAAAAFLGASGMPPEALAGMRQSPDWPYFERLAPTLPYDLALTGNEGVPAVGLEHVGVPTLALVGDQSAPFFLAVAAQVAAAMPDATLRRIEGQGHAVDHPVLAPILTAFLAV